MLKLMGGYLHLVSKLLNPRVNNGESPLKQYEPYLVFLQSSQQVKNNGRPLLLV